MVLAPILGKMVLDLMSGELAAQSIGTAPCSPDSLLRS